MNAFKVEKFSDISQSQANELADFQTDVVIDWPSGVLSIQKRKPPITEHQPVWRAASVGNRPPQKQSPKQ
ncbi:MAG: hypothetical protein AAF810_28140 [Cyanobacteria bacterium P01_D01_bin.36]